MHDDRADNYSLSGESMNAAFEKTHNSSLKDLAQTLPTYRRISVTFNRIVCHCIITTNERNLLKIFSMFILLEDG
jgi:hypothetical protein